jgi:RNA polymerase sigma-70 factor (ECF subfamily)
MTLAQLSDAALVARLRTGDSEAWDEFVERFSRYVYAITTRAYRLASHDAEDVFQEVFARAFEHLGTLRSDEAVRAWIGQLTRRLCIDRHRAAGREGPGELPDQPALDETLEHIDEALIVRDALGSMSEDCQQVLDRFFCRDQSYREIAGALGIPAGTIASRISRCLAHLREIVEGRIPPATSSKRNRD